MTSDTSPVGVISHWYSFLEKFQTSSMEFYSRVEAAVRKREIPECQLSRVDWKEGGILSARREYLRVSRGKLNFDICAAPFGNGFFFSWWLSASPSRYGALALLLLLIGLLIATILSISQLGFFWGLVVVVFGLPVLFLLFVRGMSDAQEGWDDALVAMPYLGPVYESLFRPQTYYKTDTTLMFQESVRAAVREAIDETTAIKGVRGPTELEYKPILRLI